MHNADLTEMPPVFAAYLATGDNWVIIAPSDKPCLTYSISSPSPDLLATLTILTTRSVMYGSRIEPRA
jgi:hypothetical protein